MRVPYSYLTEQFRAESTLVRAIMKDLSLLLERGDYTLGGWVNRFEEAFATVTGFNFAVGVSNGTDAIALALQAAGVKRGDWVLTAPNSFPATVGAIIQAGARPQFADVDDTFLLSADSPQYKTMLSCCQALVPVDLTGRTALADKRLAPKEAPVIITDSAQSIGASVPLRPTAACFSLHPLKNVNVWGDGGVVVTNERGLADEIRLLRNHGLSSRDECIKPGFNHRLSSLQAIVAYHCLHDLEWITRQRIANAHRYDAAFRSCPQLSIPLRSQ